MPKWANLFNHKHNNIHTDTKFFQSFSCIETHYIFWDELHITSSKHMFFLYHNSKCQNELIFLTTNTAIYIQTQVLSIYFVHIGTLVKTPCKGEAFFNDVYKRQLVSIICMYLNSQNAMQRTSAPSLQQKKLSSQILLYKSPNLLSVIISTVFPSAFHKNSTLC